MAYGSVNVPGARMATLGTDGKLDAAQRPSLAGIQGGSNPNLLINWDFRNPVNRNGLEQYQKGVNLDRWICDGEVTLNDGYITVGGNFYQIIPEQEASQYLGKQVTLSVLYHNGTLESGTITFPSAFPDTTQVINVPGTTNLAIALYANKRIQIFRLNGGPHEVVAVKTELGAHQTLAWQNEEGAWELIDPPDYALQYALCSQYSPITGEFVGSQQSNENLLDNWYFPDPINQNGRMEYESGVYTIDRWRAIRCAATLTNSGLICTNTSTSDAYIYQLIDGFDLLYGKAVTLSALIDGILLSVTAVVAENINYGTNIINGVQIRIRANKQLSVWFIDDQPHTVEAVKFELGPVQTLAHKKRNTWVLNDPPLNKALELAKCQRYQLLLIDSPSNFGGPIGYGLVENATDARICIPTPVTMRAKPSLVRLTEGQGPLTIYDSGGAHNVTVDPVAAQGNYNNQVFFILKSTGLTIGPCALRLTNPGGQLLLDANL